MKHLLIALLLSSTATFAQTSVSEYIPGSGQEEGIVYCLPKTALQIDIHIEKVTYTPGVLKDVFASKPCASSKRSPGLLLPLAGDERRQGREEVKNKSAQRIC